MRDYIVTHATKGTLGFVPRVVRAHNATEAIRAAVIDLRWQDRRITRARFKEFMYDLANFGRWYCDRGIYERDALDVEPFRPSHWLTGRAIHIVRINRKGEFVRWLTDDLKVG